MLHRSPPVFKLNVTIPRTQLSALLHVLEWQGDYSALEKLCRCFAPASERIKANICIEETLCNRIEVELEYNTPLRSNSQRDAMLAGLLTHNMITIRQHSDLLKWSGKSSCAVNGDTPPVSAERWLDVKLCLDEKGETSAKAYLGFASAPKISW